MARTFQSGTNGTVSLFQQAWVVTRTTANNIFRENMNANSSGENSCFGGCRFRHVMDFLARRGAKKVCRVYATRTSLVHIITNRAFGGLALVNSSDTRVPIKGIGMITGLILQSLILMVHGGACQSMVVHLRPRHPILHGDRFLGFGPAFESIYPGSPGFTFLFVSREIQKTDNSNATRRNRQTSHGGMWEICWYMLIGIRVAYEAANDPSACDSPRNSAMTGDKRWIGFQTIFCSLSEILCG
ncbi:hypothetical protein F5J12DRAFT_781954 [Pisolithus orientalis]|uniref:uncharacterized protein n=1 Tax=Pisolithus orientalis TaxID=936130 RepID=UPI0022251DFE|nr:uncharacterized protein F5J12DRAFT_781954 [Pisolithus orientalis]KAI6009408.1 hypothetical protein F5J12DRAFT_781954 [Pisolithus orientalis]